SDRAEALKQIAIALLILAGPLIVMSLVPFPKLIKGIAALGALFAMLTFAMKQMEKIDHDKLQGIAGTLTVLAVAMVIMAVAVK
ncbi:hypothetical protein, partial [Escherichia coli]|uniref:hypothetical protein n=1 Tax=Escherichia coli TaxID=562 RepID=UPI001486DD47